MNNTEVLAALASDLKRVSLGLQRGSLVMAKRFSAEALKRKREVRMETLVPYIRKILDRTEQTLLHLHEERTAEDALMESILLQNFIQQ